MTLLNSDHRCPGEDQGLICPERETCKRYICRDTGGQYVSHHNYYRVEDIFGCDDKIEVEK